MLLKLRPIGDDDYSVLEGDQRIGRIRHAGERSPPIWLWSIQINLPGAARNGSSRNLNAAKSEFRDAWRAVRAQTPPDQLAAAFKAMNIREDG
jgi:hypothetical protein